jgi:hypothetical protein
MHLTGPGSTPHLRDPIFRVRSFSRPEKLPLKIHTDSSGTFYSYWVEKALLFPIWSSFSRHMLSRYMFLAVETFLAQQITIVKQQRRYLFKALTMKIEDISLMY